MRRDEYDFEAELAQSVSAIVNDEFEEKDNQSATIVFESLEDEEDNFDLEELSDVRKERNYTKRPRKTQKHKPNYNMYIAIGGVSFVVLCVVLCLVLFLGGDKVETNNYDYQANMGMTLFVQKDYKGAAEYFEKALDYYSQADHVALRYYLYQCELNQGNEEKAIEWLDDLLTYDKNNITAISCKAEYFDRKQKVNELNDLISKYSDDSNVAAVLKKYLHNGPGVSHYSGSYNTSIDVSLFAKEGEEIHYTLDGTNPNAKDPLYTKPITMNKGSNTLKAVSVALDGRISDILECNYNVTYAVPEKPIISPGSGTYESEQIIKIDNYVDDGSYTAHYTLNGSLPTKDSPIYTGPIDMPGGNNVFTVIFLSKDGISSTTVKRNYNLKLAAKYTFDEAISVLQQKMQKKGDLSANVNQNANGEEIQFVYYRKQSIDEKDMYLVYFDIRRGGSFERQEYMYGIDVVTGKCYYVTNSGGKFKAEEYK